MSINKIANYKQVIKEVSDKQCYEHSDWELARDTYDTLMLELNGLEHYCQYQLDGSDCRPWDEIRADLIEHRALFAQFVKSDIGYTTRWNAVENLGKEAAKIGA